MVGLESIVFRMARSFQLNGKRALVTGGNDIAEAIRGSLSNEGALVSKELNGPVDILVNAASEIHVPSNTPLDLSSEAWAEEMTRHFEVPRQLTHAVLADMIDNGFGRIINVIGSFEPLHYSSEFAAWGALAGWAKSLTREVGQHGITVNSIQPGMIDSKNIRTNYSNDTLKDLQETRIPAGKLGQPIDIANFVVYLSSDYARYITGTVIPIDGGLARYQH
jgi:3-oxoacyl-[acyl-carrier protein] reductase